MKIEDEVIAELLEGLEDFLKDDFRKAKSKLLGPYKKLIAKAARSKNQAFTLGKFVKFSSYSLTSEQYKELLASLIQGKKIQAIKDLRGFTGLGLKEAKEAVDEFVSRNPDKYNVNNVY